MRFVEGFAVFRLKSAASAAVRLSCFAWAIALCLATALALAPSAALAVDYDQCEMATEDEIAQALAQGLIETVFPESADGIASLAASEGYAVHSYAGETQYDTAACIALAAFSSSSKAIIASGESYVDALCASSLAGALRCPILLVSKWELPEATANALQCMGVSETIIVGGEGVISAGVADAVAQICGLTPERVFGETQFDTQLEVFRYGSDRNLWNTQAAIVASGSMIAGRFADALSVSPYAYNQSVPIFFVDDNGHLSEAALRTLLFDTAVQDFIVVGGKVVVSERTFGMLEYASILHGGARSVIRLAGDDCYGTSAAVARWATESGLLKWEDAAVSTGKLPYDALAGSALQGMKGSVLVLADIGRDQALMELVSHEPSTYAYLGGSYYFPCYFRTSYALAGGLWLTDVEGFRLYLDAGHGPSGATEGLYDPGASYGDLVEYNLTKELADAVGEVLRDTYGMPVFVNDDGGDYRLRTAEARALGCGAIVSIHFNACGQSGTESYTHTYSAPAGSLQLQSRVHDALVASLGLPDRGKKTMELAICGSSVPAVLLEICFIDNEGDMKVYKEKHDDVVDGLARGIVGLP